MKRLRLPLYGQILGWFVLNALLLAGALGWMFQRQFGGGGEWLLNGPAGARVQVGERQGDVANTYQLAGYVTANLMASYQWHVGMTRLTAQLNVNNLFDVSHFAGSNAFDSAVFGMPRFFMGSIRMEF